jgi:hypothetical protein
LVAGTKLPATNSASRKDVGASPRWVHDAKFAFEKYFLGKIRRGKPEPFNEEMALKLIGVRKLKERMREDVTG